MPDRAVFRSLLAALLVIAMALPVGAHFLLNLNVRIFHVDHTRGGLILNMRTPMPYLVADKLGQSQGDALPPAAPFTTNARENGQVVHYVDPGQIASDPLGLGRIAEESLVLQSDGARLRGTVTAVVLHAVGHEPPFATLEEARSVLAAPPTALPERLYVGDVVVDITIRYAAAGSVSSYTLASRLDPDLPGQDQTANLILDYGPGDPGVFRSRGLMTEPVEISRSRWAAITTFIWEGIRHILEGLDHVLFVVCLVLGTTSLHSLLWRITGFTIGHSVTLALGFFGFVPKGAWFVPAVETGIALSIVYAAIIALRPRHVESHAQQVQMFLVTLSLGLLHGLGFSFVLQEILQVTSPNIWQSLLAFNVGVELGQVFLVLLIWPALWMLGRQTTALDRLTRQVAASGCIAIALYWTVERTAQIAGSFG